MSPRARSGIAAVLLLGAGLGLGLVLGRQGSRAEPTQAAVPDGAEHAVVRMSPELAQRAGIRVETIARRPLSPTLALVGTVGFHEDRVADVGGRVSGRVTRLLVGLGDRVEEGEPLAEIEGAELGDAVADLLGARANLAAARTNAVREAELARAQLTTGALYEEARARAEALAAEVHGAEQRLLAMGMAPSAIRSAAGGTSRASRVVLRSPIAGEVVARYAMLGQVVDPTQPILRVADLSSLWVLLDVYERDLVRVQEGDRAEIRTDSLPDVTLRGVVSHVDATIDPRTRTARVRIVVENDGYALRPGQFVEARLMPTGGARPALAVPDPAIVHVDGEPAVFVRTGRDAYELRTVTLGDAGEGVTEVREGLREGEPVVIAGAFALKSERER